MTKKITIFTPTYNRCYTLSRLFRSLCTQTCQDFIWLIVDDGSDDDTQKYVRQCMQDSLFEITYIYQKNAGKHVAFNRGVSECKTELFFCVDSDDYLTEDAIEVILNKWENTTPHIAGIVGYRGYDKLKIIGTTFPDNMEISTLGEIYKKGKIGDTALIYKTQVLKDYPFPVYEGEKFLRESIVYNQIDRKYKLMILRKVIYIGEYLEDGLSKNARKYDEQSPNGAALYRIEKFKSPNSLKEKLFNGIAFCYFMEKAKRRKEIKNYIGLGWQVLCYMFLWIEKIRRR